MTYCQTCNLFLNDNEETNAHVQKNHEVFLSKPDPITKLTIAHFINHYLIDPIIWAISAYGIGLGIFATFTFGFFTLHEYSFASLVGFLSPNQVQSLYLWYDAYPYSLIIFGSYLLALYIKFEYWDNQPKKGFLALPVFFLTYAVWDFTGIGVNIVTGYSIIWLGVFFIGMIYYLPTHKQFKIQIPFLSLLIFFGLGIMHLQNIFLNYWPLVTIIFNGNTIGQYLNAVLNEATFCYLCLTSINLSVKIPNPPSAPNILPHLET